MELFLPVVALGFLGLLAVGAVLAIVNTTRLGKLERSSSELASRVVALERRAGQRGAAAAAGETPVAKLAAKPVAESADEQLAGPPLASSQEPVAAAPQTAAPAPAEPPTGVDLESLIAGKWLNRIGIIAVLLGTAFFLKLAFDNQWIGPTGRIAIGLLAGTGLMVASQWLLRRGYQYFSEGITALGGGVLFLSLYAAWDFYQLIPQAAAFVGMALTTGALAAIAMGRDSERLAVLALGAGLSTPGLLGSVDEQTALFAYLAVLLGAFLAAAWRKGWRWIAPVALAGMLFYAAGWFDSHYSAEKLLRTVLFATVLFAELAAYLLFRALRGRGLGQWELLLLPVNAAWYGIGLHAMLYAGHRWWLTAAVLALGALHVVSAKMLSGRQERERVATRLVLAGLALTFVTAAIPIRLEGEWITIAWAAEAALLVWAGFRGSIRSLRAAGLVLFLPVLGLLLAQSGPTTRLFFNQRFASFLCLAVALGLSAYWAQQRQEELSLGERQGFAAAGVLTNVVAVWGLSTEVWHAVARLQLDLDTSLAQQMGLSLLWTVVAALLIGIGMRQRSKALRLQGLALLGLTVVKVFLADLSFLENAYRIASFLVLGIVLLAVSFRYQKSLHDRG